MKPRLGNDPLENEIAAALDAAGVRYQTDYEGSNPLHLDFFLPEQDIHLEVKGGHTKRVAEQMRRAPNVIAIQGVKSVRWLSELLRQSATHAEAKEK